MSSDDGREQQLIHLTDRLRRRTTALEQHLWRIGLEVQAASLGARPELDETSTEPLVEPRSTQLSNRQAEILWRIVRGDRVQAIASELFIAESTVRNHLSTLYEKFGVHSRDALIARVTPHDIALNVEPPRTENGNDRS
jgi:DNA-binding NarL/FixJ family response regulator